jgi:MraZ protein
VRPPEFTGSYFYHVDEKGRTRLPATFAPLLGDRFTATRGLDGCIWLLPAESWQTLTTLLAPEGFGSRTTRRLQRFFIGGAVECSLDSNGRLAVPASLREYAEIESEIVVAGTGRRVEIWSRNRWSEETGAMDAVEMDELLRAWSRAAVGNRGSDAD